MLTKTDIRKLDKHKEELPAGVLEEYIYWKGYYDIAFFSDYFLTEWKLKNGKHLKSPKFHKEIWGKLEGNNNLNIIIARGHGKTTAILIYIIHKILYHPGWSIVYIASQILGEKGIGKIRRELELNKRIHYIFGNIVPGNSDDKKDKKLNKWRQKELEFSNGSYIESVSKGQPVRGTRPKEIIIDDPQENKDIKNPKIAKDLIEWIFTSLYNTLLPGGRIIAVGTIIGKLCLIKHLRDEKKWETIEYPACDNNFNNILWPEMWSKKDLEERRDGKLIKTKDGQLIRQKGIGTANFNQEFRNIPLSKADTTIKEEWIRYYVPPLEFEYIIMAIDPATSTKERGDFTGITLVGIKDGKVYVIYSKGVKLAPRKLEQFIINVNDKFTPNIIAKEDNIEVKLTHDLKAKGLPIKSVRAHRDKMTRLLEVAGMIEVGDVYFRKDIQENLIEQLTSYPDVEHDDEMDSFVYCLKKAQEYLKSKSKGGEVVLI